MSEMELLEDPEGAPYPPEVQDFYATLNPFDIDTQMGLVAALESVREQESIDVVFDGPPGLVAGRFVEAEDANGRSVRIGEWIERPDGYWALRIPMLTYDVGRST